MESERPRQTSGRLLTVIESVLGGLLSGVESHGCAGSAHQAMAKRGRIMALALRMRALATLWRAGSRRPRRGPYIFAVHIKETKLF